MLGFRRVLPCVGAAALLALSAFAGFGCDKKSAPAAQPPSGMPPLDRRHRQARRPNAVHPLHDPVDPNAALPAGHPEDRSDGRIEGATRRATSTSIRRPCSRASSSSTAKLKSKVNAGDVIFVVARRYEEGATGPGTPLAVQS